MLISDAVLRAARQGLSNLTDDTGSDIDGIGQTESVLFSEGNPPMRPPLFAARGIRSRPAALLRPERDCKTPAPFVLGSFSPVR